MFKRFLVLVIALVFAYSTGHAQWLTHVDQHRTPSKPQASASDEREALSGPLDAMNWYWRQRTFGLGYIPKDALMKARSQTEALRALHSGKGQTPQSSGMSSQASGVQWSLVGPNNIGGRVNAVAIHPTDPKTIYIGAANGGVWKSTDGGVQWKPLTDNMQSIAMGALGIDPQVPTTVYAGTGEYSPALDAYSGYGLLRSTDAGVTWSSIGPPGIGAYTRVIVNPKNSNIVYAAAGRGGGAVLRTTDGGGTWARVLDSGQVSDLALSMNGNVAVLYAGVANKGVYRSTDGGTSWSHLDNIPLSQFRRISLDVYPANWKEVAVVSIDTNIPPVFGQYQDDMEGVVVSHDGGNSWSDVTPSNNIFLSSSSAPPQGWYDVYVRMDPKNSQHLLLGGISIWETDNAGGSWSDVGRAYQNGGIHPDQHEAAFAPSSPSIVVIGCDGGVYLSNDGGSSYGSSPVSMAITEYYGLGIDQTTDVTYGGAQDNGTQLGTAGANWNQFGFGDGAFAVADPTVTGRNYFTTTDGYPRAYDNGSTSNAYGTIPNNESRDSIRWVNPFTTDVKNNVLYFGCKHLYSSGSKGASWTPSTRTFGTYSTGSTISAIGVFGDKQTLAVGCGDGKVYYTTNGGSNWLDVTKGLPGRYVSWALFNPSSKATFYVTLSGFGAGHVFKTTNGGSSWTNISSTLPDIPVNSIVMDPTNPVVLYVGTDVGVFFSPNDGGVWLPYGTGFPNAAAVDLEVQFAKRVIRAGTHGRSIWEAPMVDDLPGIATPSQRSVWAVGDAASIQWHGFNGAVSIQISFDGGASWQTVTSNAPGTTFQLDTVKYAPTQNTLVKVSDGTQTVTSALFAIVQRLAGSQLSVVAELPFYLYDIAYDKDDNCLWATNFSATDKHIYKIDPDAGTLLDSITVALPNDPTATGLSGIKYDPKRKHLFVQRVSTLSSTSWSSKVYELTTTGVIVKTNASPASYGTGILVRVDSIFIADRMTNTINQALVGTFDFSRGFSLSFDRPSLYGPRGLTYDTKNNQYLLAFTDFEGSLSSAQLINSYVLFLDANDGHEVKALTILDPSASYTNIRGMEYDPRGQGNTAWITTLSSSGGASLLKIALEDGPLTVAQAKGVLSLNPSSVAFGNVDTGKSSTIHADLRNTGAAALTVTSLAITPAGTAFSVTGAKLSGTLQATDSLPLDFAFKPTVGGQQTATLTATFADGTSTGFSLTGNGHVLSSGVAQSSSMPGFDLGQSYPNPSSSSMTIPFTVPESGEIELRILDNLGRVVFTDVRRESAGEHERDINLPMAPNGNYVYELRAGGVRIAARKMTLIR